MKVLSRSTLRQFWERRGCEDAEQLLLAWFKEAEKANWRSPADVKALYRSADGVSDGRIVFNIAGNKYRLVVWVKFSLRLVLIKWVGTHRPCSKEEAMKMPKLKVISTRAEHKRALATIEALRDSKPASEEHDTLEVLAVLVEDYERRSFPIPDVDPVEAIRFRLEQLGQEPKDLVPLLGSRSRVSEILNRKRSLTLPMIRALHAALRIPFEALIPASDH